MMLLALPGSVYIYQGEELGLHEVPDLSHDVLDDPVAPLREHSQRARRLPGSNSMDANRSIIWVW